MSDIRANIETEMSVIGCLVMWPDRIDVAIKEGLQAEFFFDPQLRILYETIFELWTKQTPISFVTVTNSLRSSIPDKDQADIIFRLETTMELSTSGNYLSYYCLELKKQFEKISLDMILTESKEQLREGSEVPSIVAATISQIENVFYKEEETVSHIEMISEITKNFKSARRGDGVYIPSRFIPIQRKTAGKRRGKITILAARPGVGKTTLMANEARHDLDNGYRVGIVSLEMEQVEIISLLACDEAELNLHSLNSGGANSELISQFRKAAMKFESKPIFITDKSMNIHQIISWIRNSVRKNKLDIVYLDYVQLIRSAEKAGKKRHEEVADWSHILADIAKELSIALVICSQIRRAYEPQGGASKEDAWKYVPRLDSLKDSGALEEDAYIVVLLYPYPGDDASKTIVRYVADVAKHRGGPTGECDLIFKKDKQRFEGYVT